MTIDEQRHRTAEAALWSHFGVTPTERWVRLDQRNDVRVRVQELGDPEGEVALFVHGASITGTSWADLATELTELRCLLIDRPGCGLSEPISPPPGMAGMAPLADELLTEVLDGLDVERAHLVSTSMGGLFALRMAAAHPDRVLSVTHLGWSLGAPVAELPLIMRLAGNARLSSMMARMPVPKPAVRAMLRQIGLRGALDTGNIPDVAIAWNASVQNHTDTRRNEYAMAAGVDLRDQIDALALPENLLERITAPVTLVFGTKDPFGTTASMQALADGIPFGHLEVWQGAGHAVWLDDVERAAAVVRQTIAAG